MEGCSKNVKFPFNDSTKCTVCKSFQTFFTDCHHSYMCQLSRLLLYIQEAQLSLTCPPNACTNLFTRRRLPRIGRTLRLLPTPLPFDVEPSGSYLVWKNQRMAGLQSGGGRTMIDSVVWAQYINVADRQTDTQTATSPQQQLP